MEEQILSPELAYVKSMDLLEKGMSDIEKSRKKIHSLQIISIVVSLAAGAVLCLITHKILLFVIPVIIACIAVFPRTVQVLTAFRNAQQKMERDKEKLASGETDPREYYKEREKVLLSNDRRNVLDELPKDATGLTAKEREMLLKFSDDSVKRTEETRNNVPDQN